jgi:4-aminobutyrate aminotransferase-like enzyme/Ser/Thr protein kinase RdoA (MazF antagonist)/murein DD-endopeptidase MepM/ murein hydrolase activator NlpD
MMPEARVAAPVSAADASRIAVQLYGVECTARLLPGEYDDNFHLVAADSRAFVLKIMHPAREESFVDMQCRALTHLAQRAPHVYLPRVIPGLQGQFFSRTVTEDGVTRLVWLLTYIPGATLAEAKPHTRELLGSLGELLAEIDTALLDFSHPGTNRQLKWDVSRALWAHDYVGHIRDERRRAIAEQFLNLFEAEAIPQFPQLRRSVIYGDGNDHNALVSPPWPQPRRVVSVIDFGDMHEGYTVGEPAVAAAYATLRQENPLAAASAILAGYHQKFLLNEHEIAAFYPLLCARLAVSVINSAHRQSLVPDDPYVVVTEAAAWEALERLAKIHARFAHYYFRAACGLAMGHAGKPKSTVRSDCATNPQSTPRRRDKPAATAPAPGGNPRAQSGVTVPHEQVLQWLKQNSQLFAPILPVDLREGNCIVLDFSVGSTLLAGDPGNATESRMTREIQSLVREAKARVAVGRYNEARPVYASPLFAGGANPTDERRTIHLGIDLFVDPGTAVSAPCDATVYAFADNRAALDYGPVVILKHQPAEAPEFFTLYGHLSRESLVPLRVGDRVARGEAFAHIGNAEENGGWTPHLHFQIVLDLLDLSTDFPGVAFASQRGVFTTLSPDPNLMLGIPEECFPAQEPSVDDTLKTRQNLLGGNLSISYDRPLKIVRGWRQYLYDESGRAYLDVYNNVPLVGHSHPRVVAATQKQLAVLNTNTRYLHDNILEYAKRLTALLPAPLKICYFLNSGSEANELALRLARTHTRREDIIVLEHAYHGHTSTLIDISPYKFNGPGGGGQKPWVHVAPIPDDYRGQHRRGEAELGKKYAGYVGEILRKLEQEGHPAAAYIAETLPSVAGQIVFPSGYLAEVYQEVRAAGGVCIADEVQVGFGRLGTHFWGFETQGVVPDIVVLGKPIGNGFPLAAVITTAEIGASFNNGMEFFSTFGGNPVACAAGLAVLDVLREEKLQQNALQVGARWRGQLEELQSAHGVLGDVRGSGLFLGLELVADRASRTPATAQASYVVNRLRDCGILAGTDGPYHNVIKLRAPLIFSDADAELFTGALRRILEEDAARP